MMVVCVDDGVNKAVVGWIDVRFVSDIGERALDDVSLAKLLGFFGTGAGEEIKRGFDWHCTDSERIWIEFVRTVGCWTNRDGHRE